MIKNNISKRVAEKIWEWILPFASYGFNRSHAAAYATIAYQTAYLKTYFPVEFMAALLTSERNDVERIGYLMNECKKMKIEVLAPDINESFAFFGVVPQKPQIRFGLSAIKNVGLNIVEIIVEERKKNGPYKSIDDFVSRIQSRDLNKKSFESLVKAGAFDRMAERNQLLQSIEMLLERSRESQKAKSNGQKGLFDNPRSSAGFSNGITLMKADPATSSEKLTWEKELLGLFVTAHPLDEYKKFFENKVSPINRLKRAISGQKVRVGGVIASVKKIITKTGKPMLFMNLEDLTDRIEVIVFPSVISRNPTAFQENKIVFIVGKVEHRNDSPQIICDEIEEIITS